jgi:hypothetical protein
MTYAAVKTPHRAAAAVALEHFVTLKRAMLPMNGNIAEHVPAIFAVIAELLAEDDWRDVTYIDLTAGSCLLPLMFGAAGAGKLIVNDPASRTRIAALALFGGRQIDPELVRHLATTASPIMLPHVPTFHFACDYLTEPVAEIFDRLFHADAPAAARPGLQYLALLWAMGFIASIEDGFRVLMTHDEDQLLAMPDEDWRPYIERARRPLEVALDLVADVNAAIGLQRAAAIEIHSDDLVAVGRRIEFGTRPVVALNPPTNGLDEYVVDDQIVHGLIANRWLPLRKSREDARTFWSSRLDAGLAAMPPGALCLVWGGDGAMAWSECLAVWRRHSTVRRTGRIAAGNDAPGWAIVEIGR